MFFINNSTDDNNNNNNDNDTEMIMMTMKINMTMKMTTIIRLNKLIVKTMMMRYDDHANTNSASHNFSLLLLITHW